jgi:hypothetical protein
VKEGQKRLKSEELNRGLEAGTLPKDASPNQAIFCFTREQQRALIQFRNHVEDIMTAKQKLLGGDPKSEVDLRWKQRKRLRD